MTDEPLPLSEITSYHAHIYFDPGEARARAERLRALIGERFVARLGSWHDKPVGPHVKPMYQVAFAVDLFPRFVPWLMLNRMGLADPGPSQHPAAARRSSGECAVAGRKAAAEGRILPVEVAEDGVEECRSPTPIRPASPDCSQKVNNQSRRRSFRPGAALPT